MNKQDLTQYMNTQKMLDNAIYSFQNEMIEEYDDQVTNFYRDPSEEDFNNFCKYWKYENSCSHVETPRYFQSPKEL